MAKRKSARALLWLSFLLLVVGAIIMDPAAAFFLVALAGGSALGAVGLGDKRMKLIGILALLISIGLALSYWPSARSHMAGYKERAESNHGVAPVSATPGAER